MKNHLCSLLNKTPVDKLTRVVVSHADDHFVPDTSKVPRRPKDASWMAPPAPMIRDDGKYAGLSFGSMTALYRFAKGLVVCRCDCGTYELRKTKWLGEVNQKVAAGNPLMMCAGCFAKKRLKEPAKKNAEIEAWRRMLQCKDRIDKARGGVVNGRMFAKRS